MSKEKSVLRTIVQKIEAKLKLTDAGKVQNFFDKQEKLIKRAIQNLEFNKVAIASRQDAEVDALEDKIMDALESANEACIDVTADNVATNAAIEEFQATYWARIDRANELVESLKVQLANSKEKYVEAVAKIDNQIAKYKARLEIVA